MTSNAVASAAAAQTPPEQTLLVNARWSISNAMGVGFTRGMASVASTLKRQMQDCFSARF